MMTLGIMAKANRGFVGINDGLEVGTGYDNEEGAWAATPREFWDEDDGHLASPEEKLELANAMIMRWWRYREAALEAMKKGNGA